MILSKNLDYYSEGDKTEIPALIKSINPNYKYRLEKRAEEVLIFWTKNNETFKNEKIEKNFNHFYLCSTGRFGSALDDV